MLGVARVLHSLRRLSCAVHWFPVGSSNLRPDNSIQNIHNAPRISGLNDVPSLSGDGDLNRARVFQAQKAVCDPSSHVAVL